VTFGVYVHVPFCAHRCDYCDFATWTDRHHLIDAYVDACVTDLARRATAGELANATSVFFGGGTPSLLRGDQLVRILDAIPRAAGAEVTVECNPDSIDPAKLETYVGAGVNRISLGVQSTQPHVLAALGRTHDPDHVARAVAWCRDVGIASFNLDLIYGAAGESLDDWRATVASALELGPPHVSAYALTVEPGTVLGQSVADGTRAAPDDDDQAARYEVADELLSAAGLEWYEVSNWAVPGNECRHNLLYWRQGEYLGIGCAAHGHTAGRRWWNVRTPDRYIERIQAADTPEAGAETLDHRARLEERLVLALRTRAGADLPSLAAETVGELTDAGLVETAGSRLVLTRRGRLLATDVTARLLAASDAVAVGTQ
jgi:putative oxygen-independent coproporphyrinogen III oxidase